MRRDYIILASLALLFFFPFLGGVHLFDWDEINFAECAREMLVTGDYFRPQIDFEPFWEKPPLFIWLQALSMKFFGVNEFAARFPNAVCGLLTLVLTYHIGRRVYDRPFAWIWSLAWLGSILPHFYFVSGIIDPWFNLFIFLGLYGFIEFRWLFFAHQHAFTFWSKHRFLLLGGWMLGLAILTKGPTAFLIIALVFTVYYARYKFKNKGFLKHVLMFSAAATVAALLWFGVEVAMHGTWFVREFISYQIRLLTTQDSGHGGFFGYHVVVLLLGCFPVSLFALPNLWGDRQPEDEVLESEPLASCKRADMTTWMQILFWVVLILFSIVRTKIVHYSSLCYFPLTYLAAVTIWRGLWWDVRPVIVSYLLPVFIVLLSAVSIALPWVGQHIEVLKPFFSRDLFAQHSLEAAVDWPWWHMLPGVILLVSGLTGWYFWYKRADAWRGSQYLFAGTALYVASAMICFVENIECYTQKTVIDFYTDKAKEKCYIKPVGFKSFAHLFYAQKTQVTDPTHDEYDFLVHGKPDRKVYFVAKITNLEELPTLSHTRELYRKNGFVFYERFK
jgi:4-amino-4-deoxy-L-arabinose transferase-like glycosyltransferase